MECLGKPGGCLVVPGVPDEQYYFTLLTSVAGGLVAGFVSKLEPQGERPELRGWGLGEGRGGVLGETGRMLVGSWCSVGACVHDYKFHSL